MSERKHANKHAREREKVIPLHFIPDRGGRVLELGGAPYLLHNDAFYTFFERSMGDFSPFFLAIRDERRILGCKCKRCGLVRVPPFVTHCPTCDFAPTELVEVGQVGKMLSTPPITYFANSLFQDRAPFGRGRVVLEGADTAMSVMLYTTTGILTPGLIRAGTEVKLVFRDERMGEISDLFAVPTSELTRQQIGKKGLLESEVDWSAPREPKYPRPSDAEKLRYKECLKDLRALAGEMTESRRARRAIEGWKRRIAVKTKAGEFSMLLDDGRIEISDRRADSPDFSMACEDPAVLQDGLSYRGALTDAVVTGKLWISKNAEFNTIFKLDRLARFLAREKKEREAAGVKKR
jgi:uncharacterized OB-fold protein